MVYRLLLCKVPLWEVPLSIWHSCLSRWSQDVFELSKSCEHMLEKDCVKVDMWNRIREGTAGESQRRLSELDLWFDFAKNAISFRTSVYRLLARFSLNSNALPTSFTSLHSHSADLFLQTPKPIGMEILLSLCLNPLERLSQNCFVPVRGNRIELAASEAILWLMVGCILNTLWTDGRVEKCCIRGEVLKCILQYLRSEIYFKWTTRSTKVLWSIYRSWHHLWSYTNS
jgi:hypothetical protein